MDGKGDTVRVGMIGASGHYGAALDAMVESKCGQLVAVALPHPGENRERVRRHKGYTEQTVEYDSAETLLKEAKLDAVIVNPPFGWHARYSLAALRRGIAVYCEKPLATSLEDLEQVRQAAEDTGAPLVAMYEMRTAPVIAAAARLVRMLM